MATRILGVSIPLAPAQESTSFVHLETETFTNLDLDPSIAATGQLAFERVVTEQWLEVDDKGLVVRLKSESRPAGGALWQERLYQDGLQSITWHGDTFGRETCSRTSRTSQDQRFQRDFAPDDLATRGFEHSERELPDVGVLPGKTHAVLERVVPSPNPQSFHKQRTLLVGSTDLGMVVARREYGIDREGRETLTRSWVVRSVDFPDELGPDVFQIDIAAPCEGMGQGLPSVEASQGP